jgi:hypothetical protein
LHGLAACCNAGMHFRDAFGKVIRRKSLKGL